MREPQDSMIRDLVNLIRGQSMSRRTLMRGAALGAAGIGALSLTGCSSSKRGEDFIVFGNWTFYLDYLQESKEFPTLEAFNEQAGFTVKYLEEIDDNNTFYGTIKDQLATGKDTGYDVIAFTDWMNARLIRAGQIQEYDYNNMPNVTANLIDSQWDALDADEGRKYTVPWQLPASGFVWNTEEVPKGIYELEDFMRPELKGKVGVLSEMRDTMGMIMQAQGVNVTGEWGDTEFDKALEWLDDGLKSGQIGQVKGNSYTQDLERGDTLAAMAWTGDVVMMNTDNGPLWTLEVPESGGMITADSMTVPNGTSQEAKAKVEEMIDYYYDPHVQAQVADYVTFVPPVKGTQEAMRELGLESAENPLIFPDDEMSKRLVNFRTLTPEEEQKYETAFQNVMGL
ncbi:ABC transporter substrate-binding protein [Leucobacter chinensis]|uniref:ABC transporter substrate-binding protein n=1 Tax=Leucobacter chinensis TaxID=2851010 RepID=UPI001C219051|nr:spermidine/putrescine ABC transporter substrate-binding protein [Leucobacter chinensis]